MVDQEGEVIDENSYKDTKITMVGGLGFLTGIIILDNCTNDAYFAHCRTNHMPITGGEWKFEPSKWSNYPYHGNKK